MNELRRKLRAYVLENNKFVFYFIWNISHFLRKLYFNFNPSKCYVASERGKKIFAEYKVKDASTFIFTHNLGGGADKYLKDRIQFGDIKTPNIFIIKSIADNYGYYIEVWNEKEIQRYYFPFIFQLKKTIEKFNTSEIYINHLFGFNNLFNIQEMILSTKKKFNIKVTIFMHDYYCICDNFNLYSRENKKYCALENCEECSEKKVDIWKWRKNWQYLLTNVDRIISFSENTKAHILSVYKGLEIDVIPHRSNPLRKVRRPDEDKNLIKIGLLGALTEEKGLNIIKEVIGLIDKGKPNIKIYLIGKSEPTIQADSNIFEEYGEYSRNSLPDIIEEKGINLIFISSVVAETFSYTTQESIMMEMPTFCFDIGAQAEQVKKYKYGTIIPKMTAGGALLAITEWNKHLCS